MQRIPTDAFLDCKQGKTVAPGCAMGNAPGSTWLRWRRRLLRPLALSLPLGARLLPVAAPLPTLRHGSPQGRAKELLVFLPGIGDLPGDFKRNGFTEAAWLAGFSADVVETDMHLGYYLRETLVERLHEDVIRLARAQGYERIWLVGISLGGLGALLYARAHAEFLDGVVLLAPFLGHRNFIENLRESGSPRPLSGAAEDFQHALWGWLAGHAPKPPLYLGFGDADRFAPAHRLLAELLPKGHVFATRGGHDWTTWARLWGTILTQVLAQPRHLA
jgi:pimeloyl-ACP methyl ester carboxylesterase